MKTILHAAIASIPTKVKVALKKQKLTPATQAIGFFDLYASTQMKVQNGNTRGTDAALKFLYAARSTVTLLKGQIIKELGDGILCCFSDPLDCCRAALNLKVLCRELALSAKFGLTIGRVNRFRSPEGREDIIGDAVDRCARIQAFCSPAQILIDEPLYQVAKAYLQEYSDVIVGKNFKVEAKGVGSIELHEISIRKIGLVGCLMTPFAVFSDGRLPIAEKVQFALQAEREFVEVGTGLTSFAKYFTGQRPSEFRNHIGNLLRLGVSVKCFAVDPNYGPAKAYLDCTDNKQYRKDLLRAKELIIAERKKFLGLGCPTELRYFSYRQIPSFHCICIDGADTMNGRMLISPYIIGLERSECPVYQLSRLSNPELFKKYWKAILDIQGFSTEIVE